MGEDHKDVSLPLVNFLSRGMIRVGVYNACLVECTGKKYRTRRTDKGVVYICIQDQRLQDENRWHLSSALEDAVDFNAYST